MRVIAGRCSGTRLVAPPGRETRPIADRAKETLFAILGERLLDARVLDLYAGSGAIGIEALSRGAQLAVFVERHRVAADVVRENLRRTGLSGAGRIVVGDVERFLADDPELRFDLAFLDPPYAERAILAPLERLPAWLTADAMVVVKHHWRTELPAVAGLHPVRLRRLGETSLSFLTASPEDDAR